MAIETPNRDIASTLSAAQQWIQNCLVEDRSIFSQELLWTAELVEEVHHAFVDHPDTGTDNFMTKLKGQMNRASPQAQHLMAEMLWALLLFPSNMKARTKRQQVQDMWALSGQSLPAQARSLSDLVLNGIGSGGPGFNNYRPAEMTFLIELTRALKHLDGHERKNILSDYDTFLSWIDSVPREGSRQFCHMLRFFAFPHRVERMSSNNDRRRILIAYEVAAPGDVQQWTDQQLDGALLKLRQRLQKENPSDIVDFYSPKFKERWRRDRIVKTVQGQVTVTVPSDDEEDDSETIVAASSLVDARQSLQVQARLAEIGATMGFHVWIPNGDRARIRELMQEETRGKLLHDLPLNNDQTTLDTIKAIDVLWLKGRAIARAFEVEHTTAVYSGLLRMADLLALQPNMDIRLHIVAPDERREKVFREMLRPVFSLLDRGPLAKSCTFISYESVDEIRALDHLSHLSDSIIKEYEEAAEPKDL
jgi:hypothetical protein